MEFFIELDPRSEPGMTAVVLDPRIRRDNRGVARGGESLPEVP